MTRIILNGCNGKMGQVISRLVEEDETAKIVAGFDINPEQKMIILFLLHLQILMAKPMF